MIARSGVNIRIKNNDFPRIKRNMAAIVAKALAKAAFDIQAWAVAAAPVRTGYLKNSIQAIMRSTTHWIVRVGAEYGVYIEMGTRWMPARPFLYPAFERVVPSMMAQLRAELPRA